MKQSGCMDVPCRILINVKEIAEGQHQICYTAAMLTAFRIRLFHFVKQGFILIQDVESPLQINTVVEPPLDFPASEAIIAPAAQVRKTKQWY